MEVNPFDLLDAEAQRFDRFYRGLSGDQWNAPTRCTGWNQKDLLAHLVNIEGYTRACLEDKVEEYASGASEGGLASYERLNNALVAKRAGDRPEALLAEWRQALAHNHRRLRESVADAQLATAAGLYPLRRQAYYLACELAIHADDAGVPESERERPERLRWRAEFGLEALAEVRPEVVVTAGERYTVQVKDIAASLSRPDFVAGTSGRLPGDSPVPEPVRHALKVLA
jgi:uncharacterized protein (TIGR03083 family)